MVVAINLAEPKPLVQASYDPSDAIGAHGQGRERRGGHA
jgi:hypothetical protein